MLIEVVHVNGTYSPETGEHTAPYTMRDGYYQDLAETLRTASELGADILYRPNLTNFDHDLFGDVDNIARGLDADPFLAIIGGMVGLHVLPDGRKPLKKALDDFKYEDTLARQHGSAVILGAYMGECVPDAAWNLASRNPGLAVGVDPTLSIDRGVGNIRPEFLRLPHLKTPGR